MLGTELGSSTRTVCALGLWAVPVAPVPQILPSADTRGKMQLHGDRPHLAAVVIYHVYLRHTVLQVKEDCGNLHVSSHLLSSPAQTAIWKAPECICSLCSLHKKKKKNSVLWDQLREFKCWASWQNWLPEESLSLVMCSMNPWREGFPSEYLLKWKILKSWRHILFSS